MSSFTIAAASGRVPTSRPDPKWPLPPPPPPLSSSYPICVSVETTTETTIRANTERGEPVRCFLLGHAKYSTKVMQRLSKNSIQLAA